MKKTKTLSRRAFLKSASRVTAAATAGIRLGIGLAATGSSRTENIEIIRDKFGVPHIFAETLAGAAYAQAYCHAEDNLPLVLELIAQARAQDAKHGTSPDPLLCLVQSGRFRNDGLAAIVRVMINLLKPITLALLALPLLCKAATVAAPGPLLAALESPLILRGNEHIAFRDPLIFREGESFYLFYSYVREEEDHLIYWYVAFSKSQDLVHWTEPKTVTPKGQDLNFASPGNVFRVGNEWLMGAQTYLIPNFHRGDKLRFNNDRARLWLFHSKDLEDWGDRELIKVKGPNVGEAELGKMIDPFFLRDRDRPDKWWCFWKQNGYLHGSWSLDLKNWTVGTTNIAFGENGQVFLDDAGDYVLIYAPANGIGMKRSQDLITWREEPTILLGQKDWPWCETRLTGGYVADFRKLPGVGKYLMVWHSMGPGKVKRDANVNANCHIGVAWSDDLKTWDWPGRSQGASHK